MKNEQKQKNFLLMGADGGTVFTLATFVPLVISLIFSIILIVCGLSENNQFLKSSTYTYLSFALPALSLGLVLFITISRNKLDFCLAVGFKKCHPQYYVLAIALAFGSLFGLGWINERFIYFIESLGFEISPIVLPTASGWDYLLSIIIICILPAFFEECIFRGLILNGCRRLGNYFAIIMCALLFSLYHKNPAQTIYQLIIGAVLTLLAIRSGSIIPAMLYHFINNFYLVTYNFFVSPTFAFDSGLQIFLTCVACVVFVVCSLYLWLGCKTPQKDEQLKKDFLKIAPASTEKKNFIIFSLTGMIGCLVIWVVNLF